MATGTRGHLRMQGGAGSQPTEDIPAPRTLGREEVKTRDLRMEVGMVVRFVNKTAFGGTSSAYSTAVVTEVRSKQGQRSWANLGPFSVAAPYPIDRLDYVWRMGEGGEKGLLEKDWRYNQACRYNCIPGKLPEGVAVRPLSKAVNAMMKRVVDIAHDQGCDSQVRDSTNRAVAKAHTAATAPTIPHLVVNVLGDEDGGPDTRPPETRSILSEDSESGDNSDSDADGDDGGTVTVGKPAPRAGSPSKKAADRDAAPAKKPTRRAGPRSKTVAGKSAATATKPTRKPKMSKAQKESQLKKARRVDDKEKRAMLKELASRSSAQAKAARESSYAAMEAQNAQMDTKRDATPATAEELRNARNSEAMKEAREAADLAKSTSKRPGIMEPESGRLESLKKAKGAAGTVKSTSKRPGTKESGQRLGSQKLPAKAARPSSEKSIARHTATENGGSADEIISQEDARAMKQLLRDFREKQRSGTPAAPEPKPTVDADGFSLSTGFNKQGIDRQGKHFFDAEAAAAAAGDEAQQEDEEEDEEEEYDGDSDDERDEERADGGAIRDEDMPLQKFREAVRAVIPFEKATIAELRAWLKADEELKVTRNKVPGRANVTATMNGKPANKKKGTPAIPPLVPQCPMSTASRWRDQLQGVNQCHDEGCCEPHHNMVIAMGKHPLIKEAKRRGSGKKGDKGNVVEKATKKKVKKKSAKK